MRRALRLGLGRAQLHAQAYGMEGHEESLLRACLRNLVYDCQCEPSRARWLMPILTPDAKERLLGRLRIAMPSASRQRDLYQHLELCLELAKAGSVTAGDLLRAGFRLAADGEWIGLDEVLELDGVEGLRWVSERAVAQGGGDEAVREALRYFLVRWPGEEQQAREAFESSPALRPFLDLLEHRSYPGSPQGQTDADISSLQALLEAIDAGSRGVGMSPEVRWARSATQAQLEEVARIIAVEKNTVRLKRLLSIFTTPGRQTLPLFDELGGAFLRLTQHEDWHIRSRAYTALGKVRHPRIRALALDQLGRGNWLENELELFITNLEPGDSGLLTRSLRVSREPYKQHRVIFDLVRVCQANPRPEMRSLMLFVYETSPCSNCRRAIQKVLKSSGLLPEWLEREWPFDVHDDRYDEA